MKGSSKIDLHKETVDKSQYISDATLESETDTEEEAEKLKQINQHFVADFQELQKYLIMVTVRSKCHSPLTIYKKKGAI